MAFQSSSLFKLYNVMGNFRTMLLARPSCLAYQQKMGMKTSLEAKLGLPEKPKRPLTPYFRFLNQIRPSLLKKNPDAKVTEIATLAGTQWESLNKSAKEQFETAYKKDIEVYILAMEKYNSSITVDHREMIQQAKQDIIDAREKLKLKQKKREMGKPKKPASGFLLFMNKNLASRGDLSFVEFRSKVVQMWEKLSPTEKEIYVNKSKAAMEAYKVQLQQWEERMIRLGNIELVRNEALIEPRKKKHDGAAAPGKE